jgi:hypothetical protein
MALAGPMEPDPCGYFWICEYTISPNLLDSSHGYGRRAILADFFFFSFWEGTQDLMYARQAQ